MGVRVLRLLGMIEGGAEEHEVPRLHKAIRFAHGFASLGMTMLAIGCAMAGLLAATAFGTTYYVSSSSGSDANGGTSAGAAWATAAKVNAQSLQPGDSVLFKRGDVWNESLVPLTSGTAASPISFDA